MHDWSINWRDKEEERKNWTKVMKKKGEKLKTADSNNLIFSLIQIWFNYNIEVGRKNAPTIK